MPSSAPLPGRRQRRFALFAQLVAVVLAVGAVVTVVAEGPGGHPAADRLAADEIASLPPLVAAPLPPSVSPSPSEAVPSSPSPVLRAPGAVPSAGTGSFGYDARSGPVLGRAGELRRYRVAVESGSNEDAAEFALAVQTALAGPGSWVDSGRLRLQQVPGAAPRDFTVYLATARTAGRMCADGGVDIRVGGRPYTSCRAPGQVIINLDRWRLSVPHFVSAGVPLAVYRTYVVNHEVGHQLGHRHERCPGAGRPAPVMMQQTLFLNGCRVNQWPYLDGRRYAGPAL
ncbi:DUF3152 domain-containing protein [Micromonospora zamorensis]|uniref:DUF3152 domain-containing protein n=1 Tax=Micromonospora zamorensis TaxID=709883 RepID=UPI00081F8F29|nr:DUF3152 domain-containing protein [Micromonospora zamorensis]WTE86180.1 DUF3152 domain-containing protein [Micromonospora zamorensis]SCG64960.1 Protein of unknown function [Micromonospora zamorensis]